MLSPIGFARTPDTGASRPDLRVIEGGKSSRETPPSAKDAVISGLTRERTILEDMQKNPGTENFVQRKMIQKVQEVGVDVHKQLQDNADALSIKDLQDISSEVKRCWHLVGGVEGKEGEHAHAAFMYMDSLIGWKQQLVAVRERGQELTAQAHQMQQNVEQMDLGEIRRRIARG